MQSLKKVGVAVYEFGAATARVAMRGCVAEVTITGVLTERMLVALHMSGHDKLSGLGLRALVLRLDRCVIAFHEDALIQVLDLIQLPGWMTGMPGAIVCNPDAVEMFGRFAWAAACAGVERAVFTDLLKARAWSSLRGSEPDLGALMRRRA